MTLAMRRDVWEQWQMALTSGHFKQGAGALHARGNPDKPDRFCCLGVLCALAEDAGAVSINERRGTEVMYGTETAYLPIEVIEWAGLRWEGERFFQNGGPLEESRCFVDPDTPHGPRNSLALLNDQAVPFVKIAKVIKEKIKPY